MDCCNSINRTTLLEALPVVVKNQSLGGGGGGGAHFSLAKLGFSNTSPKSTLKSQYLFKLAAPAESRRQTCVKRRDQPLVIAVANAESRSRKYNGVGTPLEPSSPEGIFLSSVLQNQRHLFKFALSEQLDELQVASERDRAVETKQLSSSSKESILYRRIAEMKEKQRQIAVEDVIYMSIVHKFSEVEVPMVPQLSKCISNNKLEIWPSKCKELESIHSLEFQEMIREHLGTVLRMRGRSSPMDDARTTKIDRLHLGRIYAASILYGYFLKAACLRRQLDLSLTRSQENVQPLGQGTYLSGAGLSPTGFQSLVALGQSTDTQLSSLCQDLRRENLRTYVMGFDADTLQRCAKLKSREAVNVIEKHTRALFGDDRNGQLDSDIVITFPSLKRLVMEAVSFGSFLWDAERSVIRVTRLQI